MASSSLWFAQQMTPPLTVLFVWGKKTFNAVLEMGKVVVGTPFFGTFANETYCLIILDGSQRPQSTVQFVFGGNRPALLIDIQNETFSTVKKIAHLHSAIGFNLPYFVPHTIQINSKTPHLGAIHHLLAGSTRGDFEVRLRELETVTRPGTIIGTLCYGCFKTIPGGERSRLAHQDHTLCENCNECFHFDHARERPEEDPFYLEDFADDLFAEGGITPILSCE
jgi:hypothetical protein